MENDNRDDIGEEIPHLKFTTEIVSAFLQNNKVRPEEIPALIAEVHSVLANLSETEAEGPRTNKQPAVPVSESVHDEYLICLEDGKQLKMLKRYLRSNYNMTPEEYRTRWGLPQDYPMVAPNYAAQRSEFAKKIGLGKATRES